MDYRDSHWDILSFLEHLQDPNPHEKNEFMSALPKLKESTFLAPDLRDERCPICQETFLSVIAVEEMAEAMDTPALSTYEQGVTQLPKCGHRFCRKDLSKWIISAHKDTCPTCRTPIGLPRAASSAPSPSNANSEPNAHSPREAERLETSVEESLRAAGIDPSHFPSASTFPGGRAAHAEFIRRLAADLQGEHGDSNEFTAFGNAGDSPYQHDDRNDFSGMYS